MSYDRKCEELANHFLEEFELDDTDTSAVLAQRIQDTVEAFIREENLTPPPPPEPDPDDDM